MTMSSCPSQTSAGQSGCAPYVWYAKVSAGRRAEGVAVEEVCTTPEGLTEDDGGGDNVEEVDGVKTVFSAVEDTDEHAEKDAALDGHAALPDVQ